MGYTFPMYWICVKTEKRTGIQEEHRAFNEAKKNKSIFRQILAPGLLGYSSIVRPAPDSKLLKGLNIELP